MLLGTVHVFGWKDIKKELYPSLMHVTFVAHLLHNCAMRVCAHFKNIDEIIATIKAATIKKKIARKIFMMLVCHLLLTLQLQDGQLGLELPYIKVRTFQLFIPLSTMDKCRPLSQQSILVNMNRPLSQHEHLYLLE